MLNKYFVLCVLIFLPFYYTIGQEIEINKQIITFGVKLKEQKNNLWQENGQIESNYDYIEIYEGEGINGGVYKNKLVIIEVYANNNSEYPVCDDVEKLIENLTPLKQFTKFDEIGIFVETYKTNTYFISRSSSRMNTLYSIIPIDYLYEVRKKHIEYLSDYF